MENLDAITTLITTVGFPIAMSGALFWYVIKQTNTHKEEIDELKGVIADNTIALTGLKQLLEDKLR